MRVVIDINVFISAAINPRGSPAKVLDAWQDKQSELIISPPILEEVLKVIKRPSICARHGSGRTKKSRFSSGVSNCLRWSPRAISRLPKLRMILMTISFWFALWKARPTASSQWIDICQTWIPTRTYPSLPRASFWTPSRPSKENRSHYHLSR